MQTFYKNQLFQIIQEVGLDNQLFEIYEAQEGKYDTTVVQLKDSDLRFTILENPKSYHRFNYKYSLNKPYFPETGYKQRIVPFRFLPGNKARYDFKKIERKFIYWLEVELDTYFADVNEVDLWKLSQGQSQLKFDHPPKETDRHEFFNDEEKAQVIQALKKARKDAEDQLKFKDEELEVLNEKVEYLMDAVERLNKFDWKSILLSSTIDIVTELTLDPSGGKMLFDIFTNAFRGFPKLLK